MASPPAPKSSLGNGHVQVGTSEPRGMCDHSSNAHTVSQGLCPGIFPPFHLAYRMLWIHVNTSMLVRGSARGSLPTDSLAFVKPTPEGHMGTVGALMQPRQQVQVTLLPLAKPLLGRKHRCS